MDDPSLNPALAQARAIYAQALQDPAMAARLFGIVHAEVGGQGQQAQQAFMESVLNRGAARGLPLDKVLSGPYFPSVTYDRAARFAADPKIVGQYQGLLAPVLGGSNVANFATGNASGTVGFAGGPQVAAYGGERFGIEGPDRKWAQGLMGGQAPMPMAPPPTQTAQAAPTPVPTPPPAASPLAAGLPAPLQGVMANPMGAVKAIGSLFGSMAPKQQAPAPAPPVRHPANPQMIAQAIQSAMQPMTSL